MRDSRKNDCHRVVVGLEGGLDRDHRTIKQTPGLAELAAVPGLAGASAY